MERAIAKLRALPPERQEELAEYVAELAEEPTPYRLTEEQLAEVELAKKELDEGRVASQAEVDVTLATRRSYSLAISPRALMQVENIRAYLAERNPAAATRVVGAIRSGFERLRRRPLIGRIGSAPGSREWSGRRCPYVIVY